VRSRAKQPDPVPTELKGTRVLVVDDNATNLTILEQILLAKEMVPVTAPSALEGFTLLQAAVRDARPFRLLISDVHMPKIDGFGFVEMIRANDTLADLDIILLTSRSIPTVIQMDPFIRQHAPPQPNARKKWNAAFAEAKRRGRKVWSRVSQRYCGPCFSISRWLDDNRELLERHYVLLKIDDIRDLHGADLAKLIVSDRERFGVPFHAIFDAEEKLIIDSEGPSGNIGHPSSFEGRLPLTKMLSETRTNLSSTQVKQIVATLDE
jgi:CheY-like chemotaxis protein